MRLSLSAHAQFEDVLPAVGAGVRRRRAAPLCRADRTDQLPARAHAQHAAVPQAGDRPGLLFHQLADGTRADPRRHQRLAAGGDDDSGRADGDRRSALLAGGLSERGRRGLRRRRAGDCRDRRRAAVVGDRRPGPPRRRRPIGVQSAAGQRAAGRRPDARPRAAPACPTT